MLLTQIVAAMGAAGALHPAAGRLARDGTHGYAVGFLSLLDHVLQSALAGADPYAIAEFERDRYAECLRRAPKADSDGVKRELLAIAEEMRDVAARRVANDPHADTQLTSWAGRIQRALLNGETMETAMQAAQAKAARRAGYAEA